MITKVVAVAAAVSVATGALIIGHEELATAIAAPTNGPVEMRYGSADDRQHGTLFLPSSVAHDKPLPVVVFVHGGGWMQKSTAEQAAPFAQDLANHGVAVWNIEYRGITKDGTPAPGGWPMTYQDVAAAIDFLPTLAGRSTAPLDLANVTVAGYSAGGNLATWACSRNVLPAGAVGASPVQPVHKCVGIAGVYDMKLAHSQHDEYVDTLLGGTPGQRPERYSDASPALNIDPDAHVTVLHGKNDEVVNADQATTYTDRALAAGQDVTEVMFDDASHLSWTHLDSAQWQEARKHILQ